jgi:hypothetical protein
VFSLFSSASLENPSGLTAIRTAFSIKVTMTLFSIKEPIMRKTILIPLVSSHGIISAAYASVISLRSPAWFIFFFVGKI